MSKAYWQAKIWGLLHDPALKALHNNSGRGDNSFWQDLAVMSDWKENNWNPEKSGKKILEHIHLADYITSASDRGAIGSLSSSVNYNQQGLEISHLLSGKKLWLKLPSEEHQKIIENRKIYLEEKENQLRQQLPPNSKELSEIEEIKRVFWWLWRCLPKATCDLFQDETLLLMPAETRLPDSSIWSHASLTSAMAGALAGYDLTTDEIRENWKPNKPLSHPYLASFTFSPIQELIKASRKMRDFWAGSWILHYLAAKVSWKLAQQYGPDCLLYPSLYQQPLIDDWLLEKYPEFADKNWVQKPKPDQLLTAGFPNILVLILPKDKVSAAMQTAKSELLNAWREIAALVFEELQKNRHWMPNLSPESNTWKGWLESQWQTYWTAIPIGKEDESLKSSEIYQEDEKSDKIWTESQNQAYNLTEKNALFLTEELTFLREAAKLRWKRCNKHPFSANIGSWWNHIFDQTRLALTAVKNARTWEIPTAFGPRSTISGLGPVVHPGEDWINEGETKKLWKRNTGLFDGSEQLNATETVKRGLHLVLPTLLKLDENNESINASYPDLTGGVAGYLNVKSEDKKTFNQVCQEIFDKYPWTKKVIEGMKNKWGIPLVDNKPQKYHPRLLNSGWLVEDAETDELKSLYKQLEKEKDEELRNILQKDIREIKKKYIQEIDEIIQQYYPNNNPTDWYVLAAGDGDGMNEWLKGKKLQSYQDYIPNQLTIDPELKDSFDKFIELPKRMGPSTHSALSRALLDFSNQLVPYLTEQRYAGRLIYSGGDDVLAYTNLWEWDNWLWDIRQCFRGQKDPKNEFNNDGDYWKWKGLANRPLFTMGGKATISFGIVIAHHSVPLAIALESLWEAEEKAKEHKYHSGCSLKTKKDCYTQKDAVQLRVIYGNGNTLKATAKFDIFYQWQELLKAKPDIESSIFEQAATVYNQHPIPLKEAIKPWTKAFCNRREKLKKDEAEEFQKALANFFESLWLTTSQDNLNQEVQNWLKLAAFVIRNRTIKLGES